MIAEVLARLVSNTACARLLFSKTSAAWLAAAGAGAGAVCSAGWMPFRAGNLGHFAPPAIDPHGGECAAPDAARVQ